MKIRRGSYYDIESGTKENIIPVVAVSKFVANLRHITPSKF